MFLNLMSVHCFSIAIFFFNRQTPTEKDMRANIKEHGLPDPCSFEEFVEFFKKYYDEPSGADVLLKAFRLLDPSCKGVIKQDKIRDILSSVGDCLTEEQVDEVFGQLGIGQDEDVEYRSLVKKLCDGPVKPMANK